MIGPPPGTRVYLACGVTDMRRGFDSLSAQVESVLNLDPYGGAVFIFRGRRGVAAGEGSICVAASQRGNRIVDGGTSVDVARGDRLEAACVDRTSANRDPGVICVDLTQGRQRNAMEAGS